MSDQPTSRRSEGPHEHDPNVRYWSIKIDMGDGSGEFNMGGTAFSEKQVVEQVATWLRDAAVNVEQEGHP